MWPSVSAAILLSQSVAVDCCSSIVGLGVCDLNVYLTQRGLIHKNNRPCLVVCTHCHFDHAGGAHHFTSHQVYVHAADADEVQTGRQVATLNYVKPAHFMQQPYPGFTASHYRVPPTACQLMNTGQVCTVLLSTDDHSSGSLCTVLLSVLSSWMCHVYLHEKIQLCEGAANMQYNHYNNHYYYYY